MASLKGGSCLLISVLFWMLFILSTHPQPLKLLFRSMLKKHLIGSVFLRYFINSDLVTNLYPGFGFSTLPLRLAFSPMTSAVTTLCYHRAVIRVVHFPLCSLLWPSNPCRSPWDPFLLFVESPWLESNWNYHFMQVTFFYVSDPLYLINCAHVEEIWFFLEL